MSRAHPHAKNQRGWFPCAGSVTGSGSRVSGKHPPGAQRRAGSQNLPQPWPGPLQGPGGRRRGALEKRLFREASSRGRPGLWILGLGWDWALVLSCKLCLRLGAHSGAHSRPRGFWALL